MSILRRNLVTGVCLALSLGAIVLLVILKMVSAREDASTAVENSRRIVAIVGDSYSGGTPQGGTGSANWTEILGRERGWRIENVAVGGTGYVYATAGRLPYEQAQLYPTLRARPDIVIVEGSRNDGSSDPAAVRSAAQHFYEGIRRGAPAATLVVVGPIWSNGNAPFPVLEVRDAVRSAALSAGAVWIDPIGARWFDQPNPLIGADGVHPTDAGHAAIADHVSSALRSSGI